MQFLAHIRVAQLVAGRLVVLESPVQTPPGTNLYELIFLSTSLLLVVNSMEAVLTTHRYRDLTTVYTNVNWFVILLSLVHFGD